MPGSVVPLPHPGPVSDALVLPAFAPLPQQRFSTARSCVKQQFPITLMQ